METMSGKYIHLLFLIATFIGAIGIFIIILSRNTATRTSKFFILMLFLIFGYLISHGIHFLLMYNKDVTILDISCHSFLLLIIVTMTFITLDFSKSKPIGIITTLLIIIPSIILLGLLWTGSLIGESHSHGEMFEAHYGNRYPLFLAWYVVLLFFNIVITVQQIRKEKNNLLRVQIKVFLLGVIITHLLSFTFGLFLPWLLGFYLLVELSPLAFLTGVILFTGISIGKYNMFPAAVNKVNRLSLKRKMFFSSVIIVPIVILIIQIPLGKILFGIETNSDLIRYFLISLFVGIMVSISITFIILQIIYNPLNKLKLQASEIEKGNLGIQIDYFSNDEIGELSIAFNKMSGTLKNNAEELEAKKIRINLLLDAFDKSPAAIAIINNDLQIIEANQQFADFINHDLMGAIGKKLNQLRFFQDPEYFDYLIKRTISEGYFNEEYTTDKTTAGRTILATLTKVASNKQTSGYLFVGLDISEKKILEKQLLHSEKLATLGKMSAILAHEIKTPLTSIKLNVDMLSETSELSKEDRASYEIIRKEINRMNNLVNEVLRYSKPIDLIYTKVDIYQILKDILAEVQNKAHLKNIRVINRAAPADVEIDCEKFKQVLLNLIDNAIEAVNQDGIIEISSNIDKQNNQLSIYIENNGDEITEPDKIFEPFYTTKASGTGLGLSISRKIVERHSGELFLQRSINNQTVFVIKLPRSKR